MKAFGLVDAPISSPAITSPRLSTLAATQLDLDMFKWLIIWLIRCGLTIAVALTMGTFGYLAMFRDGATTGGVVTFMVLSAVLWLLLGPIIWRTNRIGTAILCGLASPLIGATLLAPPFSYAYVLSSWYIAFPIGVATGVLVWLCGFVGKRSIVTASSVERKAGAEST